MTQLNSGSKHLQPEFFQMTNKKEAQLQFEAIAEILLNHCALCTSKAKYRLAEIEFYYYNNIDTSTEESVFDKFPIEGGMPPMHLDQYNATVDGMPHQDLFTHGLGNQTKNGFWYLHRLNKGNSIKGGQRKGLDITIGNEDEFSYGGILIRAMQNVNENSDYVYGPSRVVDRLMSDLGKTDVNEFASIEMLSILDVANGIWIEEVDLTHEDKYSTFRYGLKISRDPEKAEGQKNFIDSDYRYFILPQKEHAAKVKIVEDWMRTGKHTNLEISKIFNWKTLPDISGNVMP